MQSNIENIKDIPRHLCLLLILSGWIAAFGAVVFFMNTKPLQQLIEYCNNVIKLYLGL